MFRSSRLVESLKARLHREIARPGSATRAVTAIAALYVAYAVAVAVLSPFFANVHTMGFHDWDSAAVYREITTLSIKRFHELPWWNPYLCGGFPAWAYSEGATNLVSPYLPIYLLFPNPLALRLEIVGSALTSIVATYLLASRFTKSVALRTLVVLVYTFNGRWALQLASGHSWHMQYAWLPLVFYFLDRSFERGQLRFAVYSGATIAVILYMGGIYPMPHAALLVCAYAACMAVANRSAMPLLAATIAGVSAVGFGAPKLFPAVDLMRRFPRTLESTESVGVEQVLQMLANPDQSFYRAAAPVPAYGWHEWGIYVGWPFVVAMLFAAVFAHGKRENVLKIIGILFFVLGFGAFNPDAPWTWLHKLPVFASQHVPSRFMVTGVLVMGLAFVAFVGRKSERWLARFPALDLLLLIPIYLVVMDIAAVSRKATEAAFYMEIPKVAWHDTFRQLSTASYNYSPADAWAGPSYPMATANEGFVGCYSVPDKADPKGAIPEGSPGYHGEAYVDGNVGTAKIVKWTPNSAEVEYSGAPEGGGIVVYNMNYDSSWRANGKPALDVRHAVAAHVDGPSGHVVFRYFPRTLWAGIATLLLSVFFAFVVPRYVAKRRAAVLADAASPRGA